MDAIGDASGAGSPQGRVKISLRAKFAPGSAPNSGAETLQQAMPRTHRFELRNPGRLRDGVNHRSWGNSGSPLGRRSKGERLPLGGSDSLSGGLRDERIEKKPASLVVLILAISTQRDGPAQRGDAPQLRGRSQPSSGSQAVGGAQSLRPSQSLSRFQNLPDLGPWNLPWLLRELNSERRLCIWSAKRGACPAAF